MPRSLAQGDEPGSPASEPLGLDFDERHPDIFGVKWLMYRSATPPVAWARAPPSGKPLENGLKRLVVLLPLEALSGQHLVKEPTATDGTRQQTCYSFDMP